MFDRATEKRVQRNGRGDCRAGRIVGLDTGGLPCGGRFSLNWATEAVNTNVFTLQTPCGAFSRAERAAPWTVTLPRPIGAVLAIPPYHRWWARTERLSIESPPASEIAS